MKREELFKKYPYILAYGIKMGSDTSWIEAECRRALEDNAPDTAMLKRDSVIPSKRKWFTVDEITDKGKREEMEMYRDGRKGGMPNRF